MEIKDSALSVIRSGGLFFHPVKMVITSVLFLSACTVWSSRLISECLHNMVWWSPREQWCQASQYALPGQGLHLWWQPCLPYYDFEWDKFSSLASNRECVQMSKSCLCDVAVVSRFYVAVTTRKWQIRERRGTSYTAVESQVWPWGQLQSGLTTQILQNTSGTLQCFPEICL